MQKRLNEKKTIRLSELVYLAMDILEPEENDIVFYGKDLYETFGNHENFVEFPILYQDNHQKMGKSSSGSVWISDTPEVMLDKINHLNDATSPCAHKNF